MHTTRDISPRSLDPSGVWGVQPPTVLEWNPSEQPPKLHTSLLIKWSSADGILVIPAYYDYDPLTGVLGYFTHYVEARPLAEVDARYIMGWAYQPFPEQG